MRRQVLYAIATGLGIAAYGVTLFWLKWNGVNLVMFPQAMLVGRGVYVAACYAFIFYLSRQEAAQAAGGNS